MQEVPETEAEYKGPPLPLDIHAMVFNNQYKAWEAANDTTSLSTGAWVDEPKWYTAEDIHVFLTSNGELRGDESYNWFPDGDIPHAGVADTNTTTTFLYAGMEFKVQTCPDWDCYSYDTYVYVVHNGDEFLISAEID